jgi:hypothetical protein
MDYYKCSDGMHGRINLSDDQRLYKALTKQFNNKNAWALAYMEDNCINCDRRPVGRSGESWPCDFIDHAVKDTECSFKRRVGTAPPVIVDDIQIK